MNIILNKVENLSRIKHRSHAGERNRREDSIGKKESRRDIESETFGWSSIENVNPVVFRKPPCQSLGVNLNTNHSLSEVASAC